MIINTSYNHIRYAWTIAYCDRCGQHLGWKFTGVNGTCGEFWGLRSLCLLEGSDDVQIESHEVAGNGIAALQRPDSDDDDFYEDEVDDENCYLGIEEGDDSDKNCEFYECCGDSACVRDTKADSERELVGEPEKSFTQFSQSTDSSDDEENDR